MKTTLKSDALDELCDIKDKLKGLSNLVLTAADGPSQVKLIDVAVLLLPISDELEKWFETNSREEGAA